jgi:predicted signal transduction protein with EAL and GGDEF domain
MKNIRLTDDDFALVIDALRFQADEYLGSAAYAESEEEEEELRTDAARLGALTNHLAEQGAS